MAKFQAGVSGNLKGRPRNRKGFDEALIRELNRGGGKKAKELALALIDLATSKRSGCVQAMKLIVERAGGRPRQAPEPPQQTNERTLTPEQVDSRLADLLGRPGVKERLLGLMAAKEGTQ